MAAYGLRPCVDIQFADYFYPAYDQIVSEAARLRYRSNGDFTAPLTIRMPTGGGIFGGQTHSQSPEALFTHVSGLKTVVPRSEEHTSELQSLMRNSYAVFCLKKKNPLKKQQS